MKLRLTSFYSTLLLCACFLVQSRAQTPAGDCPYPVLFIHGWTGNYSSWSPLYAQPDFSNLWGGVSDTFWTVNNAYTYTNLAGPDNIFGNIDDDVMVKFNNETNQLAPGCIYLFDMDNYWNQNPAAANIIKGGSPGLLTNESDSNESALKKSGPAVKAAIEKILAANPSKKKVFLATYSMGGLSAREYLQRKNGSNYQWWSDPFKGDGHKVAKLYTVGTPHRGSNTLGNLSADGEVEDRNAIPDLFSEAVRDMRYSYSCGFLNLYDCPGIYLFGGNENDLGSWYRNNDVDCNGNGTSGNVAGINISGTTQFGSGYDAWAGTKDNPNHALPTNLRYTYYVSNLFNVGCSSAYPDYGCGGDGVVDDERQWIYNGGNGKTDNYLNGTSIPMPTDGANYRLSDRIASKNRVSHIGQQGDLEYVIRGFDEGDFANFAWDINRDVWYAGTATIRPEKVPSNSELTNTSNRNIDGDWYKFTAIGTGKQYKIEVVPQPNMDVRVDVYSTAPNLTTNANAPLFQFKTAGTSNLITLTTPAINAGTYYFRITHWLNTAPVPKDAWKIPYKYRVTQIATPARPGESSAATATISQAYPQPVTNVLNLEIFSQLDNQPALFSLRDAAGRVVFTAKEILREGDNAITLPADAWGSGLYLLDIQAGATHQTIKVVKL